MEKYITKVDYYRCDIVAGRLYRCLTSLFQDFLDIQFTRVLGSKWIDKIVILAYSCTKEQASLKALCEKEKEVGKTLLDKTSIDVTIANTLIVYTCNYLVSVPRCNIFSGNDLIDIVGRKDNNVYSGESDREEDLHNKLVNFIRDDIKVVLKCQSKIKTMLKDLNVQPEKIKNELKKIVEFNAHIKRLVDNKNRLHSHLSIVNDAIYSKKFIVDMILNLENFIAYLTEHWDYSDKEEFITKYRKEINILRYLMNDSTNFNDVNQAIDNLIEAKPTEKVKIINKKNDDQTNKELRLSELKRCFSLLSNSNNHCAACTALTVESDFLENPCATIMLAFMYYCGWESGRSYNDVLMPLTFISNPEEWLAMAETLKTSDREQATAYYIGYAMINNNSSAFKMAGFLGVRLENYEIAKMCFKYAGETDEAARNFYEGLNNMPDEISFKNWAAIQNNKR